MTSSSVSFLSVSGPPPSSSMRFAAACLRTNYSSLLPRRSRNPWFFTSDRQLPRWWWILSLLCFLLYRNWEKKFTKFDQVFAKQKISIHFTPNLFVLGACMPSGCCLSSFCLCFFSWVLGSSLWFGFSACRIANSDLGFLFFSGESVNYCDFTYCWSLGFGFWVGMVLEVLF